MIALPPGARIWLACGVTDLRRGFDGLAALVRTQLAADPYAGHLFVFRGRRGNRLKILWWSGDGHGGDDGGGTVDAARGDRLAAYTAHDTGAERPRSCGADARRLRRVHRSARSDPRR